MSPKTSLDDHQFDFDLQLTPQAFEIENVKQLKLRLQKKKKEKEIFRKTQTGAMN